MITNEQKSKIGTIIDTGANRETVARGGNIDKEGKSTNTTAK